MPEGPECYTTAAILRTELAGASITRIKYTSFFTKNKTNIDTELVKANLPLLVEGILARGKRIIFVVSNKEGVDFAFVWFFAMTGSLSFVEAKHTQIVFTLLTANQEEKTLYYQDIRTWGYAKFVTTGTEIETLFRDIGPDYMRQEVTFPMFKEAINNKRRKNKEIAAFLMQQEIFSGIGNYLRAEILYTARLSPYRKLGSFSEAEIEALYSAIYKILTRAYKGGGLTIGDYFSPYGDEGRYAPQVYQRRDVPGVIAEKYGPAPSGPRDNRRTIWWKPERQL